MYNESTDRSAPVSRIRWIHLSETLIRLSSVSILTAILSACTHYPPSRQTLDPDRLRVHVEMLSVELAPRNYLQMANMDASADYISDHFHRAGGTVYEQTFHTSGSGYRAEQVRSNLYRNVIAGFGPHSAKRIVVGAHYDSFGDTPGADDNASGVAGLIELAYLLGRAELEQRVELVAYTLEEPPFFGTQDMGSAHHAGLLYGNGVELEGMICLEMIGFFSDEKGSQRSPSIFLKPFYPDRGNFIAVVGGFGDRKLLRLVRDSMRFATDLPVYGLWAPRGFVGIDLSDHRNYWHRNYDAVMVTDTAFYRNSGYHLRNDTPDTLDYNSMAHVVVGVYEAVVRLANEAD